MNSIQVNSLPLKDVIRDIAQVFNISHTENCGEYLLQLPPSVGEGTIRGINFDGGLGLIQYDCIFNKDFEIHFVVNNVHPLKFLYTVNGILHHRFENEEELHEINQYQNAIVASSKHNGHVLFFKAEEKIKVNSLEIDREKFQTKMECDINSLDDELEKLFKDIEASGAFYYNGNYSLNIADILNQMIDFTAENFTRKLFLEGMAYQILTHQILQYQDDKMDEGNRTLLRSSELKQIHMASSLIENNISQIPTVENLAKEAGLNINKLQEGFKKLYGSTVNNYVQKKRLDAAYNLLTKTDLSISEIVNAIGLSSKSYFSKIFKEKYEISPSDFRKKHRNQ
ncbi:MULTISPECIES: helix-turn-helix domain-containing protein [Aequorivita]|uniref:Helix-turn-helix domain-containing protein n=1 Tax=Aequorivita iocasae TaxID=2803865 RepID=A0ABX7DR07_9FLAO|nr:MULTISPECIES: AraC family transcriptional regulator [Aequorivita]QQX76529.1 helix-turn-helix domain-containing protein [Aequorivita iocasae]UCA55999.1 AraC family transcriptional regulator [Aequorivita sp. F7]